MNTQNKLNEIIRLANAIKNDKQLIGNSNLLVQIQSLNNSQKVLIKQVHEANRSKGQYKHLYEKEQKAHLRANTFIEEQNKRIEELEKTVIFLQTDLKAMLDPKNIASIVSDDEEAKHIIFAIAEKFGFGDTKQIKLINSEYFKNEGS